MQRRYIDNTKISGVFDLPDGTRINGDLNLAGEDSFLELFANTRLNPYVEFLTGTLSDQTRVSLIGCTPSGSSTWHGESGIESHSLKLQPHFILFGSTIFKTPDEPISHISFSFEDAATLFYDPVPFGVLHDPPQDLSARMASLMSERSNQKIPFAEDAIIFYYTGKDELFRVSTELGTITAHNNISYAVPTLTGIQVDNQVVVRIEFPSAIKLDAAVDSLLAVLRFIELIVGRPQQLSQIAVTMPSEARRPLELDLFWCLLPNRHARQRNRSPHPMDILVCAGREPAYFAQITQNWFRRHLDWRIPRFRLSANVNQQNRYSIDRLIAAANTFDILPESVFPSSSALSADFAEAQRKAREMFEQLPDHMDRNTVLQALSRMGKNVLKRKIHSRLNILPITVLKRLPHLQLVLDEAVNCRNHFVHGTKSRIDYEDGLRFTGFFSSALEFVFATSDLIECGWNIEKWVLKGSSLTHPFADFLHNYPQSLLEFRHALPAQHPAALST